MRKLTEAERRSIRRRIRYLCSKQKPKPEPRRFGAIDVGYGPPGAVRLKAYQNKSDALFLACKIEVDRGSGGFQHVRDIVFDLFKQASGKEDKATAELLEVGSGE